MQEFNCAIQIGLLILVFFFWGISSRRFGAEVDTSLHPMRGSSSVLLHIIFGIILALIIGVSIAANFRI